jgi:hypothetical protein
MESIGPLAATALRELSFRGEGVAGGAGRKRGGIRQREQVRSCCVSFDEITRGYSFVEATDLRVSGVLTIAEPITTRANHL